MLGTFYVALCNYLAIKLRQKKLLTQMDGPTDGRHDGITGGQTIFQLRTITIGSFFRKKKIILTIPNVTKKNTLNCYLSIFLSAMFVSK